MGQRNSKAASDAVPNPSIFPIGGGHTGEGVIPERTAPTVAHAAPAIPSSTKAGPSNEIQPEVTPAATKVTHAAPKGVTFGATPVGSETGPSKNFQPKTTQADSGVTHAPTPISSKAGPSREIRSEAPTGEGDISWLL